jgi:hypothetical protein
MRLSLSYRWLMVAAGALITCVALVAEFSLAVYLQPMAEATGWSRAGISGTMTFDFLRIGPRPVALCGAVLIGAGQLIAAQMQSLFAFQTCYGLMVGLGTGAIYAPLIAASANWFEHRHGLAVSRLTLDHDRGRAGSLGIDDPRSPAAAPRPAVAGGSLARLAR